MALSQQKLSSNSAPASKPTSEDLFKYLMPEDPNGARAKAVWKELKPEIEDILGAFYSRINETPNLAAMIEKSPHRAGDLAKRQTTHWEKAFITTELREFEADARKIGSAHVRIGLTSDWFIAGYGRVLMEAVPRILKAHRFTPQRAAEAINTLISRMFLDMALANESYSSQMTDHEAIEWREDNDYQNLRTISDSMHDINKVTLNLAVLSNSTAKATSSNESVAAAVEELVSSIQQLSDTSQNAANAAGDTNTRLIEGVQGVVRARGAIATVAEAAERSNQSLSSLQGAAAEINDVMSVIQSIADQTNLLALNATIEAARAGDAGKGFAVVASEVKALANQTASATEDVASRIQTLQAEIDRISANFAATREAIDTGEETLNNASDQIEGAGSQMEGVAGRMSEVAQILEQQESSAREISSHIVGMTDLARENSSCLDDIATSMTGSNDNLSKAAGQWVRTTSSRSLCEMAKIDHTMFKKRVVDAVLGRGQWKSSEVPDNHNCRLGKWYDSVEDSELRNLEAFRSLLEPHHRVHKSSTEALAAKERGDMETAMKKLTELDRASIEVVEKLNDVSAFLHSRESISERRKRERKPIFGEKVELKSGERTIKADVVNENAGGIGIEGVSQSEVGQLFEMFYKGNKKEGTVRWASGNRGGIKFED